MTSGYQDEHYNPVLIDFDFCKFLKDDDDEDCTDVKMFGEDLLKHLLESNMFNEEKLCSDTLLKQLCDGHFIEVLMPCSILSKSALTIEQVIKGR